MTNNREATIRIDGALARASAHLAAHPEEARIAGTRGAGHPGRRESPGREVPVTLELGTSEVQQSA